MSRPADGTHEAAPVPQSARYELGRLLGRGGAGSVCEAWDRQLQRRVAIKRIPASGGGDDALAEARLAADLRHPAFVAVHEVFVDDAHACIVMELVQGRTLAPLAASVSATQACDWIASVAEALSEAHARGIVHGDLKPGNLMLDEAGRLRILDFGIGRLLDPLRTMDDGPATAGTLRYMAPELLLGSPTSVASDVHALGLVLLELLQGAPVFAGQDGLALAHSKIHAGAAPPRLGALGGTSLARLVEAMTAHDPALRPPSMSAVRAALLQARRELDAPTAPVTTPRPAASRVRRLSRRSAAALAALAALAVTLAGAAAAWVWLPAVVPALESPRQVFDQVASARALLRDYDEEGNLDRAVQLLREVLARHPRNATAEALLALAYCILDGSDASDPAWLQRADASSQRALQLDDQLALAHAARAWYLDGAGRHPQAEAEYDRALLLDPHDEHALLGKARMLVGQHRFAPARAVLDVALASHPRDAVFRNQLGTLLFQQADYAGAEQAFRAAIALKPDAPIGYANLGAALQRQDRLADALAVFQQGLAARPDGRLYGNLGTALFGLGRYAEAADAFEHAVSADKGNPNDYLKWANLGDALRWVPGREAAAQAAYRHALLLLGPELERTPDDVTRTSRAGLYAAKAGQADAARRWTRAAVARAPQSPDVLFRATVAAELVGDREDALRWLGQALAHGYPAPMIEQEPELQALRRTHSYHQLLTENLP